MEMLDKFIESLDYLKSELPLLMSMKEELDQYLSKYQRPDDAIVTFFDSLNEDDFEIKEEEIEELQRILDKYAESDIPIFLRLYKESETLKVMVDNINNTADTLRDLENTFKINSKYLEQMQGIFTGINFRFINTTIYQYFDKAQVNVTISSSKLISSELSNIVIVDRYGYGDKEIEKKLFHNVSDPYLSYITLNGKISYERNLGLLKDKKVKILDIIRPQEL